MPTTKERLEKHERQLEVHDRQIKAIRDLVREGMRMLVETRRLMVEFRKDMRELAAAQKRTDASLKDYLDSLKRGGPNGHNKGKLDLQVGPAENPFYAVGCAFFAPRVALYFFSNRSTRPAVSTSFWRPVKNG